jgi:hypothetical protein
VFEGGAIRVPCPHRAMTGGKSGSNAAQHLGARELHCQYWSLLNFMIRQDSQIAMNEPRQQLQAEDERGTYGCIAVASR